MIKTLPALPRPHYRPSSPWTEERIAHLTRLWSQGVSAERIADELRCGLSRNAVLAKIHRLGIGKLSPFGGGRNPRRKAYKLVAIPPAAAGATGLLPLFRSRLLPLPTRYPKPYVDDPRIDADI